MKFNKSVESITHAAAQPCNRPLPGSCEQAAVAHRVGQLDPMVGSSPTHPRTHKQRNTLCPLELEAFSLSLALQVPIIIHVPGLILVTPIFQELHQYSRNYTVFSPFRTPAMRFVAALSSNIPIFQSLVMAGYGHESVTLLIVFF